MKRLTTIFTLALALLAPGLAAAAELTSRVVVLEAGEPLFTLVSTLHDVTADEERALQKRGLRALDTAAKGQDKGGAWCIQWTWGDEPTVETCGLKFKTVNRALRQVGKTLDDGVTDSERAEAAGRKRPYGKRR